jgi:hypothetical protein
MRAAWTGGGGSAYGDLSQPASEMGGDLKPMSFRKILFRIHLGIGCLAGVVVFIMSTTGVLLAYERQIIHFLD